MSGNSITRLILIELYLRCIRAHGKGDATFAVRRTKRWPSLLVPSPLKSPSFRSDTPCVRRCQTWNQGRRASAFHCSIMLVHLFSQPGPRGIEADRARDSEMSRKGSRYPYPPICLVRPSGVADPGPVRDVQCSVFAYKVSRV